MTQLVERLRARLGDAAVTGLRPHPDHRPELAWRCMEPGAGSESAADLPGFLSSLLVAA